jgi:tRNA-dihydrouridine synthase 4
MFDVTGVSVAERLRYRISNEFLQSLLDRRPADSTHNSPYLKFLSPMVRYSKLPFRMLCRRYGADLAFTPMIVAKDLNRCRFVSDLAPSVSASLVAAQAAQAAVAERRRAAAASAERAEFVGSAGAAAAAAAIDAADESSFTASAPSIVMTAPSDDTPVDPYSALVSIEEFQTAPADRPLVAQFAVNDPVELSRAAAAFSRYVDGVDLNCGCPQTWVLQDKIGAALSGQPELVAELVRAARATLPADKTVSVKIRLRPDLRQTVELVRRAEAAGAQWVTIHGRTKEERTAVPVRADAIALLRSVASVPVIFNGDLNAPADMDAAVARTGAAGVLIARGALANPGLFCGLASLPARAVEDYCDIALRYGGIWAMHSHHLSYMLFAPLARARRSVLTRAKSFGALSDAGADAAAGGRAFDASAPPAAGAAWALGGYGLWGGAATAEEEEAAVEAAADASAAAEAAWAAGRGRARVPVFSLCGGLPLERRYAPELSPSEAAMDFGGRWACPDDGLKPWAGDVEPVLVPARARRGGGAVTATEAEAAAEAEDEEDRLWRELDTVCGSDAADGHDARAKYWL